MLELDDLDMRIGGVAHLDTVSVTFPKGQLTTLLGRTGAGKTSLMRTVAGLERPDRGVVRLDGTDWNALAPWQRPVAMVTQQFINYPHLSVLDNVAFPLVRRGEKRARAHEAARNVLARVGLSGMVDRRPGQLSGGQQQRVAIARALVKRAPVLLLDEPFVNLDYKLREGLREELVELVKAQPDTVIVYASTDPREALQMGEQTVLMAEGRVLQVGTPRDLHAAPATVDAARVVSDPPINLLPLDITNGGAVLEGIGPIEIAAHGDLRPGRYTVGLRADDIAPGGTVRARVALSEVTGSETVTHLGVGGHELVMLERTVTDHPIGSEVGLRVDSANALMFDGVGRLLPPSTGAAPNG